MIPAEEARKRTENVIKDKQFKEIETQIELAIREGNFYIEVMYSLDAVQKELQELGYKITHKKPSLYDRFDDCEYWVISWQEVDLK